MWPDMIVLDRRGPIALSGALIVFDEELWDTEKRVELQALFEQAPRFAQGFQPPDKLHGHQLKLDHLSGSVAAQVLDRVVTSFDVWTRWEDDGSGVGVGVGFKPTHILYTWPNVRWDLDPTTGVMIGTTERGPRSYELLGVEVDLGGFIFVEGGP